jgi:NAD(P)-dependent dehydrogenase (short-subunit alcohol dehydrogenase family)
MAPGRDDRSRSRQSSRVAVFTGGASGIGGALASAMASRGDRVVAFDVDGGLIGHAVNALNHGLPGQVSGVEADVRGHRASRPWLPQRLAAP